MYFVAGDVFVVDTLPSAVPALMRNMKAEYHLWSTLPSSLRVPYQWSVPFWPGIRPQQWQHLDPESSSSSSSSLSRPCFITICWTYSSICRNILQMFLTETSASCCGTGRLVALTSLTEINVLRCITLVAVSSLTTPPLSPLLTWLFSTTRSWAEVCLRCPCTWIVQPPSIGCGCPWNLLSTTQTSHSSPASSTGRWATDVMQTYPYLMERPCWEVVNYHSRLLQIAPALSAG